MTKPRHVMGLTKAEIMPKGPWENEKTSKLKGRAAEGIRYQKRVHKALEELAPQGKLLEGPWIRFSDTYGTHWCQPDHVLEAWDRVLVAESKLSLRRLDTAVAQLTRLYKPCLQFLFPTKPVVMVVAFKHWVKSDEDPVPMIEELQDLMSLPVKGLRKPHGWNYRGI